MDRSPSRLRLTGAIVALLLCAELVAGPSAAAQTVPLSLDAVASVDGDAGSQVSRKATGWFDLFGAVRIVEGLDLRVRPVVYRRSFDGRWQAQVYELAARYERPGSIGWRVDMGVIPSPIGLSTLENRPDRNPVVSPHSTLYLPVPRFDGSPTQFLLAASYPLGAQLTVSSARWDTRFALIDSSPIRGRPFLGPNKPPHLLNAAVGAGVTPRVGLRVGGSLARGPFASAEERVGRTGVDRAATVAQIETEWSFGYTRLAGEWLWTWRDTSTGGSARVNGGWVEATQTLSPRWFGAVRYDDQHTVWSPQAPGGAREEYYRRVEAAVGFRLTPDVTLRSSYLTRKGYVVFFWDDQVLASIVFARKLR